MAIGYIFRPHFMLLSLDEPKTIVKFRYYEKVLVLTYLLTIKKGFRQIFVTFAVTLNNNVYRQTWRILPAKPDSPFNLMSWTKSQLISKEIFGVFKSTKNSTNFFVRIPSLVSNLGKIKTLYYIRYPLISISVIISIFFIWHILEASVLIDLKTPKIPYEINWPL